MQEAKLEMRGSSHGLAKMSASELEQEHKKVKERINALGSNAPSSLAQRATLIKLHMKMRNEEAEQIDEISKETAQNYLKKTVDPIEGMPRPGFKNLKTRMKGIERASKIVTKPQQKNQHMRNVLQQRAKARELVQNLADQLRRKKEKEDQ